ncbi:MAG TPA: amidase [Pirellulales bacterium]|jgi:aspartyl-tRNA(Asn)/glutamyl-tRNA(Gln) amidotransferase subunit A|nr:amidase [Pirellulales bacterium]
MQAPQPNVLDIATSVQSHERTAVEVAERALASAERLQEEWRAFITMTPGLARKQAEQVDQQIAADKRLPLAGVPFAVKDLFDVEGVATTCGSKVFADRVAKADATVVRRLVAAGAVLLGKLNMHECAFGFTGENPHYGNCKNPWNPERIAGGSSSGSAVAVALDICPFTIGSDTGGSIRHPAALCGLVGLKPTYGRVSRMGGVPLSWTMDHVGPLARTAAEAAHVLQVIAGHDPADETTSKRPVPDYVAELARPLAGVRIGLPANWFFDDLEADVERAVDEAVARLVNLGARTVNMTLPHMDEAVGAHRAIIFSEASSYYQSHLAAAQQPGQPRFGHEIRPLLEAGLFFPAVDYLKALRMRRTIRAAWSKVFSKVDCLVTPTSPLVATRFGQQTADLPGGAKPLVRAYLDLTLPFNLSGHPAINVPCGLSSDGLPIGMQVVGKPFGEGTILRVAHQFQQATDWHQRRRKDEA